MTFLGVRQWTHGNWLRPANKNKGNSGEFSGEQLEFNGTWEGITPWKHSDWTVIWTDWEVQDRIEVWTMELVDACWWFRMQDIVFLIRRKVGRWHHVTLVFWVESARIKMWDFTREQWRYPWNPRGERRLGSCSKWRSDVGELIYQSGLGRQNWASNNIKHT